MYLVLLMGLLEDYFVPLHNFYLTPDSFDQKVRACPPVGCSPAYGKRRGRGPGLSLGRATFSKRRAALQVVPQLDSPPMPPNTVGKPRWGCLGQRGCLPSTFGRLVLWCPCPVSLGRLPPAQSPPKFSHPPGFSCLGKPGTWTDPVALDTRASVILFPQSASPVSPRGRRPEDASEAGPLSTPLSGRLARLPACGSGLVPCCRGRGVGALTQVPARQGPR